MDERWFVCRARVVGIETEPLRVVEKTKRRRRHVKSAKNKMRFTVLRVAEVGVRVPEDEGSGTGGIERLEGQVTELGRELGALRAEM